VNWDEMAVVGQIARPHGIRGQVVVNPETDFPDDRFAPGAELFIQRDGAVQSLMLTTARFHQGRPIIGVEGVDDMNAAQRLAGLELRVPQASLVPLPPDTFYRHDLVGCRVETVDGSVVGTVVRVEGSLGDSRLVVEAPQGEVLIPLVQPICQHVELDVKRIVIAPPEGLLDVNVTDAQQANRPSQK